MLEDKIEKKEGAHAPEANFVPCGMEMDGVPLICKYTCIYMLDLLYISYL